MAAMSKREEPPPEKGPAAVEPHLPATPGGGRPSPGATSPSEQHSRPPPAGGEGEPRLSASEQRIVEAVMGRLSGQFRQLATAAAVEKQRKLPGERSLLDTEGEEGAKVYEVSLQYAPTARVKAANEGEAWMKYKEKVGLTASLYQPSIGEVQEEKKG